MNLEEEARFERLLGKNVIRTERCWWLKLYSKNVYLSWPSDFTYSIKRGTINGLLLKHSFSAFCLTNDVGMGSQTYFWYAGSPYDLSTLKKKARNQTRRGLENCRIAKLDWNDLAREGPRINKSSVIRQKRDFYNPIFLNENLWFADCMCCNKFNDIEAWGGVGGGYVGKDLAAYVTVQLFDDGCARIRSHASDSEFLRFKPNNALIFTVTKNLLSRNNINHVTYGGKSSDPHLDHFKENMGFFKKRVFQYTFFSPAYLLNRVCLKRHFSFDTISKSLKLLCAIPQSFFLRE